MTTSDDFIKHYGKKGMKWGSRSAAGPSLGSSKDSKRASAASSKAKIHSVKSLSNKELSDLNNRLGLEQRFSQLNPSVAKRGKAVVGTILATGAAINTVIAFSKSPAGQAVARSISRKQ